MYRNRKMDELHDILKGIPFEKIEKVAEQLPRHHSAPQTMKPQEKPDIDAEDHHMEDYSEDDLKKAKDKGKETGHTLTEPKEDELKVEPKKESKLKEQEWAKGWNPGDKFKQGGDRFEIIKILDDGNVIQARNLSTDKIEDVHVIHPVQKAKESKLKEQKDVVVRIIGGEDEGKSGLVKNWVKGLGYQDVYFEGSKKQISYKYLSVGDESASDYDKEIEEFKQIKKRNQLYLCNECFKTFRANENICVYCQSEKVEKITLQEGEEIPESKLHETVQELVGEVPGIDRIDQGLLNKAIENGVIPNQFPELDVMIDELSAADVAKELGVKDIDDVDLGDIDAVYLKYILLPKAKEASRTARESKIKENNMAFRNLAHAVVVRMYRDHKKNLDFDDVLKYMSQLSDREYNDLKVAIEKSDADILARIMSGVKGVDEQFDKEKDSFKTVAKGIEDEDTADKVAKEKEGHVVADEEDEKKFAVIKKEE